MFLIYITIKLENIIKLFRNLLLLFSVFLVESNDLNFSGCLLFSSRFCLSHRSRKAIVWRIWIWRCTHLCPKCIKGCPLFAPSNIRSDVHVTNEKFSCEQLSYYAFFVSPRKTNKVKAKINYCILRDIYSSFNFQKIKFIFVCVCFLSVND